MSISAWGQLNNWLWDGSRKSTIPDIIIKPKSPVTHMNLLTMFMNHGPLNYYLNKYMNNSWIFSIDKAEVLKFIKLCILDYKIKKGSTFYRKRLTQDKLYNILREKIAYLKNDDISLLTELIIKSKDRDQIYETLGMEIPKLKKSKKKKVKKISQKIYISENFSLIEC